MVTTTTSAITTSAIATATAWEFWSLGRVRLLSALVGLGCMNVLYYDLVARSLGAVPESAQLNLFAALFFVNLILIVFMILRSRGADSVEGMELDPRAFLLPLPTWQLVLSRLFFPTAAAGLLWIGVSIITLTVTPSTVIGEDWPLFGPALVAAVLTAWGLTISWLPVRPRPLKSILGLVVLSAIMTWTAGRFSDSSPGQATRMWTSVTAAELATIAAFLLTAYATAVFATAQARRGATLGFSNLGDIVDALSRRWRRAAGGTFRSPASAQVWFEWRQKGWVIPLNAAAGLVIVAVMTARGDGGANAVFPMLSQIVLSLSSPCRR